MEAEKGIAKIPLSRQELGAEVLSQLPEMLETNYEELSLQFASIFSNAFDLPHALPVNSGTSAIHIALRLANVQAGDLVLCSDLTYVASAFPISYCGAKPVFIDVDRESWNMSPDSLELAILLAMQGTLLGIEAKKPKAIVVVHLFGMPARMPEIMKIANKYQIPVIEDAAEALGARIGDHFCGSFGDFACFSFNNNKIVTTLGGGLLATKTKDQLEQADYLSSQARSRGEGYTHFQLGYNYRMNLAGAALGCLTLPLWQSEIQKRKNVNGFYRDQLHSFMFQEQPEPEFHPNHWLSAILFKNKETKHKALDILQQHEIESRSVWKPMHLQPYFKGSPFIGSGVSEEIFEKGLCLPSSGSLSQQSLQKIVDLVLTS